MMFQALHLLFLLAYAAADSVPFENCGSQYTLIKVDLEGCTSVPCVLDLDSYTNVSTTFQSNSRSDSLRAVVRITVYGVDNSVLTNPTKPCDGLTSSSCPVLQGQVHEYRAQVFVERRLVPGKGILTWKLLNDFNVEVVCFKVDVILRETEPYLKLGQSSQQVRSTGNRRLDRD